MENQYFKDEKELMSYMTQEERDRYVEEVKNCEEIGVTRGQLFKMYSRKFCDRKLGYSPSMYQTNNEQINERTTFRR